MGRSSWSHSASSRISSTSLRRRQADAPEQAAGQFWTDFIRDTKPVFRTSTFDQLSGFIQPTWQALIDGAMYCEPQLKEIIERQRPDVIVEDNVNCFPALTTAGVPFVRIVSCQPLEMKGPDVPPTFSGSAGDDRSEWDAFRAEYDRTHRSMWNEYNEWVQSCGARPLADLEFIHESEHLNLYSYPGDRSTTPIAGRSARPGIASTRRCGPRMLRSRCRRSCGDRRRAGLPVAGFARLGRRRADAAAGRRARPHAAPIHRVERSAARHLRSARQHVGRSAGAADQRVARGRSGHHPRRQQHDHRELPLRQADGAAPPVLGPVRQRPACARDGIRGAAVDSTGSRTPS